MRFLIALATVAAMTFSSGGFSAESGAPVQSIGTMNQHQMSHMQQHMKQMQDQIEQIRATNDPAERQRLMQEHMESMNQGMTMMRGMGGPMMKGMMGGHDAISGMGPGMKRGDPKQQQDMMSGRMDMMQMMMEQMMQHQQMMMHGGRK